MYWLQSTPWVRWAAAVLIAVFAIWLEFRPDPTTTHPFAIEDIEAGMAVDTSNTEQRSVPAGLFDTVEMGAIARAAVQEGEPVLATDLGESGQVVPNGWWSLEIQLPRGARSGDAARIVLLDMERVADGIVVETAGDDPLGSQLGLVAVEPERADEVARAAGEGRAVVLVAPP